MKLQQHFSRLALMTAMLVLLIGIFAFTVQAANNPSPDSRAPALNWGDGCRYVVRPGDTLFRIAVRYGVSWWYLAQINRLYNPNYIYAGMILFVPCGGEPPYPPPPRTPCGPSQKYDVQPGDNLFRIALNYGSTVNAIRDANNLWGRVLRPGTTILIPCPQRTPMPPVDRVPLQPLTAPTPAGTPMPGSSQLAPEPSATVNLQNSKVNPATVTIKAGQSVLWTNSDQKSYTIVSGIPGQPSNFFSSPQIAAGGTFLFQFTAPGNYSYYIMEDPTMTGQVNVTP